MSVELRLGEIGAVYTLETTTAWSALHIRTADGSAFEARLGLGLPFEVHVIEHHAPGAAPLRLPAREPPHVSFLAPGSSRHIYEGQENEVFERALSFCRRVTTPGDWQAGGTTGFGQLRQDLGRAVRAARRSLDADAWRVARGFHPRARLHVLRCLLADETGRVRQLALACPGLLVLSAAMDEIGGELAEESQELMAWVEGGQSLRATLLLAATVCLKRESELATPAEAGRDSLLANSVGDASVEDCANRLRLLVRRAGPRVAPRDLLGLPPPSLVPEDIPAGHSNASWYAVTRTCWNEWLHYDPPREAWSFLTRAAMELARSLPFSATPAEARAAVRTLARGLLRRGLIHGTWPRRLTRVEPLLEALDAEGSLPGTGCGPAWRLGCLLERVRRFELGEVVDIEPLDDEHPWLGGAHMGFPPFPSSLPTVRGAVLCQVRSPLELAALGRKMENCVATWCERLATGRAWIFGGTLDRELATVEVLRSGAQLEARRALGVRNRSLGPGALEALEDWLRAFNQPTAIAGGSHPSPLSA